MSETNLPLKFAIIKHFGTQRSFAKKAGLAEIDVSHWVCGRRIPRREIRQHIATQLKLKEQELWKVS